MLHPDHFTNKQNPSKDTGHTFSYMTDPDYIIMGTKLTVDQYTIASHGIPNNNEIHLTSKATFDKTGISHLSSLCVYH
jgi:hypothetical protein